MCVAISKHLDRAGEQAVDSKKGTVYGVRLSKV